MDMPFLKYLINFKQRYRAYAFAWLCAGMCVFSTSAYAQTCRPAVQTADQTVTFSSPLTVPASLAVGGTIASAESTPYFSSGAYCVNGTINVNATVRFTTPVSVPGVTGVYATNVAGVGMKVEEVGQFNPGLALPTSFSRSNPTGFAAYSSRFRVTLIKTAATVGSGTIAAGQLASYGINGVSSYRVNIGSLNLVGENRTCTVNTGSINIPLGNVAGSSFANVGSVSPTSAAQNIGLTCTASPRVRMTLQGTQAAGGPNTTVALTGAGGAGVAQGIGVQILYSGTPLVVNSGTPTVVSTAAGATLNVPVNARYYRIGTVTAGRANASPTLRFDYN